MTDPAEMACQELVELITEYLEETLHHDERARLEAHLTECDGCTIYLEQMRTTIRLTGLLTEESIPPGGKEQLLRVFGAWKRG